MRYLPMTFTDALNSALSKDTKLRVANGYETSNPEFIKFLKPNEVLQKLSISSKVKIRLLINSVWEVEEFTA